MNVGNTFYKGEGVMTKRQVFYIGLVIIAAMALFGAPMAAMATHPAVATLNASGAAVSGAGTEAYSPKQTCGGCHFNCATGLASTNTASFCLNDTARMARFGVVTLGTGTSCNTVGMCPDYETLDSTSIITKEQGYINVGGTISYMSYTVKIPNHGASTGKHSTEGRNEGLVTAQRTIWAAPSTISGPGMWGRY
jgi:hypothetical protein